LPCFSRAIKRAGISIWYTEGFNPRPFMTFSLPLSLGTESFCESVDVRITDEMTDEEIVKRLNGVMPTGIVVTSASEPVHKADEIRWARFLITLETNDKQKVIESVKNKISASEIIVEKQGKKGRKKVLKQIDIKGDISSYNLCECENDQARQDVGNCLFKSLRFALVNSRNNICADVIKHFPRLCRQFFGGQYGAHYLFYHKHIVAHTVCHYKTDLAFADIRILIYYVKAVAEFFFQI
jgi:radical SAM-linked protein